MLLKYKRLTSKKATRLYHKRCAQAFGNAGAFQCDISWQAVAVRRVTFAPDQGQEIPPAGGGDSESVRRDVLARQLFFLIGDGGKGCLADAPAVRLGGFSHDDGHDGVPALERQLDGSLADGVRLVDIHLGG